MQLKTLVLALFLATPLLLSPASAAAPTVDLALDAATYSASSAALESAPLATATVLGADGEPAAGVEVRFVFLRNVQFVGNVANETVVAVTDAAGVATARAPLASCLPGTYVVIAFALGDSDAERYTVGA